MKIDGITLVALILTIIVLVILVAISIKGVFETEIIYSATKSAEAYASQAKKEKEQLNELDYKLNVAKNKKPKFTKVEDMINQKEIIINIIAVDEDDEQLSYTLYTGDSKDNLIEYGAIKEKQGQEVSWKIQTENISQFYYKVEVSDRYTRIDTGGKKVKSVPIIESVNLEEKTTNSIKIMAKANDGESDRLIYSLKVWEKINVSDSNETITNQKPVVEVDKESLVPGEEIILETLQKAELQEYTNYIYRVDVLGKNGEAKSDVSESVRTYCSGRHGSCAEGYDLYCRNHCLNTNTPMSGSKVYYKETSRRKVDGEEYKRYCEGGCSRYEFSDYFVGYKQSCAVCKREYGQSFRIKFM